MLAKELLRGMHSVWLDVWHTVKYIRQMPDVTLPRMDYENYWRMRGYHSFQPRYRIITDIVAPDSTVLDIGCGEGLLLAHLSQVRSIKGLGLDISSEAVRIARERAVQAEVADILTWRLDEEYDYIIISEVLEHLPTPEDVIAKVCGHFRRALIVSIPNIGYYPHRLRLLFGRFPLQWGFHPAEHLRYWTVVDFKQWIRSFGLEVTAVYSSNGLFLLHKYWPNLFGNQVVFVIKSPGTKIRR